MTRTLDDFLEGENLNSSSRNLSDALLGFFLDRFFGEGVWRNTLFDGFFLDRFFGEGVASNKLLDGFFLDRFFGEGVSSNKLLDGFFLDRFLGDGVSSNKLLDGFFLDRFFGEGVSRNNLLDGCFLIRFFGEGVLNMYSFYPSSTLLLLLLRVFSFSYISLYFASQGCSHLLSPVRKLK